MAQFKISLMSFVNNTPNKYNTTSNGVVYTIDTMSDFHTQSASKTHDSKEDTDNSHILDFQNKHTKTYTYDEKISIHQNGQKELSFSMDSQIIENAQIVNNPFISQIHIGSTILLEDKYGKQFIFNVKNINYTFKQANITYAVTCQDHFSYSLSKQNQGYEIQNDPSKDDFIGAKTIDWWTNKILKDCKVGYNYIPFEVGVYLNTNQDLVLFEDEMEMVNVEEIIKPIYSKDEYSDYQTPLTFSCSNSTANAALIALGEQLDLQINTFEWQRQFTNYVSEFDRMFWFEPKKNPEISGLTYSPNTDVQSFSLSFNGDSLTTVLNVESKEVGDDLVSILPATPGFFLDIFSQQENWEETTYYRGMFQEICTGQQFSFRFSDANQLKIDNEEKKILLPDKPFSKLKPYYKKMKFSSSDLISPATVEILDIGVSNSFSKDFKIEWVDENNETIIKENYSDFTFEEIQSLSSATKVYLEIEGLELDLKTIVGYDITISFEREATEEELEYAKIADSLPWLENRIIDFSYFVDHNLITPYEYNKLQDTLVNKLRITMVY